MRDVSPERDDALAYFVPEAADLLDIMSRSLLALEQGRGAEDDVASLFRAIHTLKGAAYVVGHVRVGDLAHRIEDVLATARSNPGSLDPAAVDVIHAAVEAARWRARSPLPPCPPLQRRSRRLPARPAQSPPAGRSRGCGWTSS